MHRSVGTFWQNSEQLTDLTEEQRVALLKAAGRLSRPDKTEILKRRRDVKKSRRKIIREGDRQARAATGIRTAREAAVFKAPAQLTGEALNSSLTGKKLSSPRNCHICKAEFTHLHFFYDSMCKSCGDFN